MSWALLLMVLVQIESGGDHAAVGDRNMTNKAYGILQIRKPYLDDVNRVYHTSLTMDDVRKSQLVSRWVAIHYLKHYGKRYQRLTGKVPTYEIYARIHNGGPNGWKRDSTVKYWQKFNKVMNERRD